MIVIRVPCQYDLEYTLYSIRLMRPYNINVLLVIHTILSYKS